MLQTLDSQDAARITANQHRQPHAVLGAHAAHVGHQDGVRFAAHHPEATAATVLLPNGHRLAAVREHGLFTAFCAGARLPLAYAWAFNFADGHVWETDDPYRFLPTVGEVDQHLFNEGTHR